MKVLVGGEDVEITWATRNELLKLLQRAAGTLQVVLYLENVGTLRPVDLDRDGKEHLFRALTYWQDHPATGSRSLTTPRRSGRPSPTTSRRSASGQALTSNCDRDA